MLAVLIAVVPLVPFAPGDEIGSVQQASAWSEDQGGFPGALGNGDWFGRSVAVLGDLDGDGHADVAVGAARDGLTGTDRGAVWILHLDPGGEVRDALRVGSGSGGFTGVLADGDRFGSSVCGLGDLDGDGVPDLAVGARFDDDGGPQSGAVWILFPNADGTIRTQRKLSADTPGLNGQLDPGDRFGAAVAAADLDGDGRARLFVGAPYDDGAGANAGTVWSLELATDGTLLDGAKLDQDLVALGIDLDPVDLLGRSVATIGDLDGDGVPDLAISAFGDDTGAADAGAVFLCFLSTSGRPTSYARLDGEHGPLTPPPVAGEYLGRGLAGLGDLVGDGVPDLAVGSDYAAVAGVPALGSIRVLRLDPDGTVRGEHLIADGLDGLALGISPSEGFGFALAGGIDLDGDGVPDLLAGTFAAGPDDAGVVHRLELSGIPAPSAYGCAADPASFEVGSGALAPGKTLGLLVHDPSGSSPPGSLPVVGFSPFPLPCGLAIGGVDALGAGGAGELLLDPASIFLTLFGEPWTGTPAAVSWFVPPTVTGVGLEVFAQGFLLAGSQVGAGLGLVLTVGS